MEPILWAHAVSTLEEPIVVAGLDGAKGGNREVMDSVNMYYGFGLGRDEMKLVRQCKVVKKLEGDAGDLLKWKLSSGGVKMTKTQGRKKKRWEHLPNVMKSQEKKAALRKVNIQN